MPRDMENQRRLKREWYLRNKEEQIRKKRERKRQRRVWIRSFKIGCMQCPENHPACLLFHHREPCTKTITVAEILGKGWGEKRILEEIAKCDVLCLNCHSKWHWNNRAGDAKVA